MKLRINKKVNDELLYCKICNDNKKFLSLTAIAAHITSTHKIKTQNYYDKYIKTIDEGKCLWCGKITNYRNWQYFKYCSTTCKNAHYYSIPENIQKHRTISYNSKTCEKMSISAKLRNTAEYKKHLSDKVKEYYEMNPNAKTITSITTSNAIKAGKLRKKYIYDNETFQSYNEVCFYIYLKEHHIRFKHLTDVSIEYECRNTIHHYFPDFKVYDTFVEIKGKQFFKDDKMINPYDRTQDDIYEAKHQCMLRNKVKIITSKRFIDYVNKKYGNNFKNTLYVKKDKE